jgi:hypothetical protein
MTVETGDVSRRLKIAMDSGRAQAAERRERDARATAAYETFLENVAVPVAKQLANAMKVEGLAFTAFTPAGGLRLASDRNRDDFIELALERGASDLQVVGHVSHARGSRTIAETLPVKDGFGPGALTDEDVLTFLLRALRPWLER